MIHMKAVTKAEKSDNQSYQLIIKNPLLDNMLWEK